MLRSCDGRYADGAVSSPAHLISLTAPRLTTDHGPAWPRVAASLPWKPGNLSQQPGCENFLRWPVREWRCLFPNAPDIPPRAASHHGSWVPVAADHRLSSVETRKSVTAARLRELPAATGTRNCPQPTSPSKSSGKRSMFCRQGFKDRVPDAARRHAHPISGIHTRIAFSPRFPQA